MSFFARCRGSVVWTYATSAAAQAQLPPIFIGQSIATTGSLAEHGRGIVLVRLAHFEERSTAPAA